VGLFAPILTNEKGKKLGKTEEKAIYLNEDQTSPYSLYQVIN
jgi:tyrosyl-tRNA synthetase